MRSHFSGYTLVELLLVITILSMISALAIISYRNKMEDQRIDQAALEIQHILEAALTYNVDQGDWPTPNNLFPCEANNPNDKFITDYLPNRIYRSNYGDNYCWGTTTPLFWVALKIPFNDSHHNYQIANRIAARLPNAVAVENLTSFIPCTQTSASCFVRAEVAIPAMASNSKGNLQIIGFGYCDPEGGGDQPGSTDEVTCSQDTPANHYTVALSCPSGYKGQVSLTPNFYQAAALPEPVTVLTVLKVKTTPTTCEEIPAGSSIYFCPFTVTALYDGPHSVVSPVAGNPGTIGTSYIAYCVKQNRHFTLTRW